MNFVKISWTSSASLVNLDGYCGPAVYQRGWQRAYERQMTLAAVPLTSSVVPVARAGALVAGQQLLLETPVSPDNFGRHRAIATAT